MAQVHAYQLSEIPGFKDILLNNKTEKINFTVTDYVAKNNNNKYKIVRYDKDILSIDLIPVTGLLRSVIINDKSQVISFAPPKSIPYDSFVQKYQEPLSHGIIAEEFVEGTMINVFWDTSSGLNGAWEISTRNTVGGDVSFYKYNDKSKEKSSENSSENSSEKNTNKTFREMFLEAAQINNFNFNMLNPTYCYSFVLQHPNNRIVVPFKQAQLYLVGVYEIMNTPAGFVHVYPRDLQVWNCWGTTGIKFPQTYEFTSYEELKKKYASMNTPYDILGVVLKNKYTLERCKLRNPVYEYVRHLRGNQPKIQYQYLELRKEGKVGDFLKFYPENKKDFSYFRDRLHDFTNALYQNYINCYIKKQSPLKEFPAHFRTHMFNIHKSYIDVLKPKNEYVTNTVVIKYVNDMHSSLQMYSLNACLRTRHIDFVKADSKIYP